MALSRTAQFRVPPLGPHVFAAARVARPPYGTCFRSKRRRVLPGLVCEDLVVCRIDLPGPVAILPPALTPTAASVTGLNNTGCVAPARSHFPFTLFYRLPPILRCFAAALCATTLTYAQIPPLSYEPAPIAQTAAWRSLSLPPRPNRAVPLCAAQCACACRGLFARLPLPAPCATQRSSPPPAPSPLVQAPRRGSPWACKHTSLAAVLAAYTVCTIQKKPAHQRAAACTLQTLVG